MSFDLLTELKRIQNTNNNQTFDQLTDSLEAIRDFIASGGSSGGLAFYGTVDAVPGANQFTINSLAGLGAGKFNGANNPYFAFVFRDAVGAAAAPQGEQQPIVGYVTATGTFTTAAFTAAVAVGDEIIIFSPHIAAMGLLWAELGGSLSYIGECAPGMAPSTNVMDCPNLAYIPDQTFTRGYQMIVLHNSNAAGNPPEMEMRAITNFGAGLFATAPFSANVEEDDLLLIIHNSLAVQISAYGIADAGSGVGIVRDAARVEANDWWNGQTIMMLSGLARGQKRPIADFIAATDDIIPAPNFDAAVAAGDLYVILAHYNPIVPRTANDTANALTSDVVGRKDDTAITTPDNVSSIIRYLKGLLSALNMNVRPLISLYEGWQDEAGIDATIWTVTNPATGAAWARGAIGELLMAYSSPNANENARIRSNQRWVADATLYGVNKILRRFCLEFEAHFIGFANFDNVNFFMGLTPAVGDTRATNNIGGFALVGGGNALQTLTDAGGAETVNTGFGENLLLTNKFKMDVSLNSIAFYLNEVLIATHVVNLPNNAPFYLNFYAPTGAGGAATIRLGGIRAWYEDIAR